MKVKIIDLSTYPETEYIVSDVYSCKDDTDRSVFNEVIRLQTTVTMGKIIGTIIQ